MVDTTNRELIVAIMVDEFEKLKVILQAFVVVRKL